MSLAIASCQVKQDVSESSKWACLRKMCNSEVQKIFVLKKCGLEISFIKRAQNRPAVSLVKHTNSVFQFELKLL